MEPATRHLEPTARLRLVDVSLGAGRGQVRFGAALTGVLTGSENRATAARFLALTVAGPRPPECDGSVEVDGEIVSVRTLPEPLLAPEAPNLIDRDLLRVHWQGESARRRDDLAATHASHRLEGYRIDAALERARLRSVTSDTSRPSPRVWAAESTPADSDDPFHHQLRILLADLDARPGGPLPEAVLLADAWEAQALLVRVRSAVETDPGVDVEALERRVNDARLVVESHTGALPDDIAALIEDCHQAVVDTEAAAFAARRKERARAISEYEEAVAAELVALSDAGLESYAAFVETMAALEPRPTAADRIAAQRELAAARAALDDAFQIPDVPTRAELTERDARMRSRATELLGHEAGDDPAFELRALRVETEVRIEILEELAEALRDAGIEITGDVEACARAQLGMEPPADVPALPAAATASGSSDVAELEQQQMAHQRALEVIEEELVRVDAAYHADLARLAATDFARSLEWVLSVYRSGELLNGQLPLVFDGALDGLAAATREVAVRILAEAVDLQAIVVSDDPEVLQSVAYAGGSLVRWPEPVADRSANAAPQPTPRSL